MSNPPLAPGLLLAMPDLLDPNFRRTVVLLVHHNEEGTFGLVLNRPTEVSALDLCRSLGLDWRGSARTIVHWGGPVQPETGWVLAGGDALAERPEATPVADGVHFAASLDALRCVAESPPPQLRLFLGYAGWAPGQLEEELGQGAWMVAPFSPEVVFELEPGRMWEQVWRSLGIDPATIVPTPGVH